MNWFETRRRMLLANLKNTYTITYDLNIPYDNSPFMYLQINGTGEQITGSGTLELSKGDYIHCYAYHIHGSCIHLDGNTVASTGTGMSVKESSTYDFYPDSDSYITYRHVLTGYPCSVCGIEPQPDSNVTMSGTHLIINTRVKKLPDITYVYKHGDTALTNGTLNRKYGNTGINKPIILPCLEVMSEVDTDDYSSYFAGGAEITGIDFTDYDILHFEGRVGGIGERAVGYGYVSNDYIDAQDYIKDSSVWTASKLLSSYGTDATAFSVDFDISSISGETSILLVADGWSSGNPVAYIDACYIWLEKKH